MEAIFDELDDLQKTCSTVEEVLEVAIDLVTVSNLTEYLKNNFMTLVYELQGRLEEYDVEYCIYEIKKYIEYDWNDM